MKPETIEAYILVTKEGKKWFSFTKDAAEFREKLYGGTVVRLTGEMPMVPRKREFIGWVMNGVIDNGCDHSIGFITYNSSEGLPKDCIKVRVTVEELSE